MCEMLVLLIEVAELMDSGLFDDEYGRARMRRRTGCLNVILLLLIRRESSSSRISQSWNKVRSTGRCNKEGKILVPVHCRIHEDLRGTTHEGLEWNGAGLRTREHGE